MSSKEPPTEAVPDTDSGEDAGVPDDYTPYADRINVAAVTNPYAVIRWAADYLGVRLTRVQREIVVTVLTNPKTLVISANGVGKSYCLAVLIIAFMFTRTPAAVLATSGTYPKMRRTLCRPIQQLHENNHTPLPGQYKHSPPRIDVDNRPNVFFEAASPSDPGELEGVHSKNTLGVIEEADKASVNAEVIDSMESLVTNENDHLVAIANPPDDETDVVAQLMESDDSWTVLEYSAFDSHNVEIERGVLEEREADDPTATEHTTPNGPIPAVISPGKIRKNYEDWNNVAWPGLETVIEQSDPDSDAYREDLDARWYRRRLGHIPPAGALSNRPFRLRDVKNAYMNESPGLIATKPDGIALDVARKGADSNVLSGIFGKRLVVMKDWTGKDHVEGEQTVRNNINTNWGARFAVDATPEGSGLADNIATFYPAAYRFNAGSNAVQDDEYKSKWAEALATFGDFLNNGGTFSNAQLREEAIAASRNVEFEEKWYESRDDKVWVASKKDEIKDALGRSPDFLDSAIMATWAASDDTIPTVYRNQWDW